MNSPKFTNSRFHRASTILRRDARNGLDSPVIEAWKMQAERDKEFDELLRGGFSKDKMCLG